MKAYQNIPSMYDILDFCKSKDFDSYKDLILKKHFKMRKDLDMTMLNCGVQDRMHILMILKYVQIESMN